MVNKSLFISIIIFFLSTFPIQGQTNIEPIYCSVSFFSIEHVYVRFSSTDGIEIGDTLYISKAGESSRPILTVKSLSSISTVCKRIDNTPLNIRDNVYALHKILVPNIEMDVEKSKQGLNTTDQVIGKLKSDSSTSTKYNTHSEGRFSVTSYTNTSSFHTNDTQRLRYNLNLNAQNIGNTRFSFESYISYTHKLSLNGIQDNISSSIYDMLKIYTLNAKIDFGKSANISIGRRINPSMANIGAIDGIQIENTSGLFSYGAMIGYRPNPTNYWINDSLLDCGGYIAHKYIKESLIVNSSIALFNQSNNGFTDRRYAYIQHNNSIISNLYFMGSMEIDFFELKNNKPSHAFNITSTFLSLKYRPWNRLNLSLSYDARKNVYYFQTYKNMAETLLDVATRQGLRFQFTYNPWKTLYWGANIGYRLPNISFGESTNAFSHLTYYNLPLIDGAISLNGTALRTPLLNGTLMGGSYSRDIIDGKLFAEIEYQRVNYTFSNGVDPLIQDIGELSITWNLTRKLLLSASYELTFEPENKLSRVFINLSQRF